MVELPEEAVKMFDNPECDKKQPLIWISTVEGLEQDGTPHLAPVCFVKVIKNDELLVAVNFVTKTMYNIETNSKVAVGVAVPYEGFLIKGSGTIIKKGPQFDEVQSMVKARFGDKIKPKAAISIYVEEVYSLKPGPGSKRIA